MGTPDFSVPTLRALVEAGHSIVGVYCQPDKQKGRGKQIQMPPVKEAALSLDLPVYQPITLLTVRFYHHGLFVCLNMDVLISMHLYCQNIGGQHLSIMLF